MVTRKIIAVLLFACCMPIAVQAQERELLPMPRGMDEVVNHRPQDPESQIKLANSEASVFGLKLAFEGDLYNLKGRSCQFVAMFCDEHGKPIGSLREQFILCKLNIDPKDDAYRVGLVSLNLSEGTIREIYGEEVKTVYILYGVYDRGLNKDTQPTKVVPISLKYKPKPPIDVSDD